MGLKRDSIGEWGAKTHGYANRLKEQQKIKRQRLFRESSCGLSFARRLILEFLYLLS